MDISSFLVRLIFLALPGILSYRLYQTLNGKIKQKDWEDIINIALFSLISYSLYGLVIDILINAGYNISGLTVFQAFVDEKTPVAWHEIYIACGIGLVLALIAAYTDKHKFVNKLARFIGVSSKIGNQEVWITFNKSFGGKWIFVRDAKLDLTYYGHIAAYSELEKERELIIKDVDVYSNSTGDFLYKSQFIYIERKSRYIIRSPLS